MKLTKKKVVIFTMLWWLSCTTPVQVPDQTDPIERIDFEYIQARGEEDVSDSAYVAVLVKNPFNGVEVKEVKVDWSGENKDLSILYTKDLNDIGIDEGQNQAALGTIVGSTSEIIDDIKLCQEIGVHQLTYDFRTTNIDSCMKILEHFADFIFFIMFFLPIIL